MKILFVTDLCPVKDDEKGLPNALLDFITAFKEQNCDITLFRPNIIPNVLIRRRKILKEGIYMYKGIKCINKNYFTPFFKPSDFDFLDKDYDVILSHMPPGMLCANKISKLLNIPYFVSVHSSDIKVLTRIKYSFLRHAIKKSYLEANGILARSYWLLDKIKKIIPQIENKTGVIPSGIDSKYILDKQALKQKIASFDKNNIKVLSVANFIKRKNLDLLIKAFNEIDFANLTLIGEGCPKNLNPLIKDKNRIKIFEQKDRNEILSYMEQSDVFILPSVYETFGLVYLEALAKGCIVICTENSGMSGFIKDCENGFLIKPDIESIKNAILKIKNSDNLSQIATNGHNLACNLNREKMIENYINLIKKYIV